MKRYTLITLLICVAILAGYALAEELDGEAIIKKMADREESISTITESQMTIVDAQGNQRVRRLRTRAKKVDNRNHVVTTFLSPPDVRGVKFLVIENPDGDDTQRIYLPALRRVRRITASSRGDSFMGSTFSYADLQSHDPDKGKHKRLADMALNGQDCYVVQTIPKDPDDTDYGRLVYWVRKDNFMPIRGEFYNKDGKLWKVLEILKLEKKADGTWLTKQTKMSDVISRRVTVIEIINYQIDVPIDDSYYTDRFLSDETQE